MCLCSPYCDSSTKKNLQNQRQLGEHDFCPFCHNSEFSVKLKQSGTILLSKNFNRENRRLRFFEDSQLKNL
jgi:hypothetical protein